MKVRNPRRVEITDVPSGVQEIGGFSFRFVPYVSGRMAGKVQVTPLDSSEGWKGRSAALLEKFKPAYSHRGGYTISPAAALKLLAAMRVGGEYTSPAEARREAAEQKAKDALGRWLVAHGAVRDPTASSTLPRWNIQTVHGPLSVTPGGAGAVMSRFEGTSEATNASLGASWNGKWNFHGADAVSQFRAELLRILPTRSNPKTTSRVARPSRLRRNSGTGALTWTKTAKPWPRGVSGPPATDSVYTSSSYLTGPADRFPYQTKRYFTIERTPDGGTAWSAFVHYRNLQTGQSGKTRIGMGHKSTVSDLKRAAEAWKTGDLRQDNPQQGCANPERRAVRENPGHPVGSWVYDPFGNIGLVTETPTSRGGAYTVLIADAAGRPSGHGEALMVRNELRRIPWRDRPAAQARWEAVYGPSDGTL